MEKSSVIILFACVILVNAVDAQILHPVKWSYAAKKLNATEAIIMLKADVDPDCHIYSTKQPNGGPVKTSFTFMPSKEYDLIGIVSEPKPVTKYEKAFEMNVSYFENSVIFQQKVKLNTANPTVKSALKFMVCNDTQCLPPETVSFEIPIK